MHIAKINEFKNQMMIYQSRLKLHANYILNMFLINMEVLDG